MTPNKTICAVREAVVIDLQVWPCSPIEVVLATTRNGGGRVLRWMKKVASRRTDHPCVQDFSAAVVPKLMKLVEMRIKRTRMARVVHAIFSEFISNLLK